MTIYDQLKDTLNFEFDVQDLQAKYDLERDRRLRPDTTDQFVHVSDHAETEAKYHTEDPHNPVVARDPEDADLDFLIIGGGWVGMLAAARLKEAGIENIRIIDGAGDFGGVWYWNRYPGARCDIESYIYLPLLEETGYMPKERFSSAAEIYAYAQHLGRHFGLYDVARFHTWIQEMRWDDQAQHWMVTTNRGDTYRTQFALVGTGSASKARLPGIPGIDDFTGRTFHTSRWDFDYTGGDSTGGLTNLADKRVAVIGTGASAIQVVPHIGAAAEHTYVFQRTPSFVGPRNNRPTDPEWFRSLQPGWQRRLRKEFEEVLAVKRRPESPTLVEDETFLTMSKNFFRIVDEVPPEKLSPEDMEEIAGLADHMTMESLRKRIDRLVARKEHAELLKPWYGLMCKRPTFSDDYYETFNRPNVTLVDVADTQGVEHITSRGVVANGVEYEVDCIVFASGFEITSDFTRRLGVPIHGLEGRSLSDYWDQGMRTMHGIMSHGFPNLFVVGGLFTNTISPNYCTPIDGQVRHVVHVAQELRTRGARMAHPTKEAEGAFVAEQLAHASPATMPFGYAPETCTPGYYNQEGKAFKDRRDSRLEGYPLGGEDYWRMLEEWRSDGRLEGLEILTRR